MWSHDEWLAALERQASLIDTFDAYIDRRRACGDDVELSLEVLRDEIKVYRRLLSRAPIDVLLVHASTSARSRHL